VPNAAASPIPFSITTLKERRFVDVNAAFERRYGYAREEVLGHTVHELNLGRPGGPGAHDRTTPARWSDSERDHPAFAPSPVRSS